MISHLLVITRKMNRQRQLTDSEAASSK